MPKWLSDYHYGRITGLPGNSVAGAMGAAEYNRNNPVVKMPDVGGDGPVVRESVLAPVFELTVWCVGSLWPLRWLKEAGEALVTASWWIKAWPTAIGLAAGALPPVWNATLPWAWSQLTAVGGDWSVLLGAAIGACLGSLLIPMIGAAIMMTAALIGFVIALAIVTTAVLIVYLALAAYLGWPPFTAAEPAMPAASDVAVVDVFKG